ncbi:MAG: type II secretion system protein GspG [Planctomycetota bacterium]
MSRRPTAARRSFARRSSRFSRRPASRSAFTLLELLLVLAILVVLGGIVAVNVVGVGTQANVDATQSQLKMLQSNIDMYRIRMNSIPESLESLRDGPSDAAKKAKWVAPIITEIPKDAWGNDLKYTVNGNSYEIRSGGVDGQMGSDDDIVVTP